MFLGHCFWGGVEMAAEDGGRVVVGLLVGGLDSLVTFLLFSFCLFSLSWLVCFVVCCPS